MVQTTHYELATVFAAAGTPEVFGKVATQLMRLHALAMEATAPIILECGVHLGWSSGVLAHACEQTGGKLISLDIVDCSDAIVSDAWSFIQTSDTDIETVLARAPILREGIHLLYIDSLHDAQHVARLMELYYPFVRQGGYLAFDDVDPGPYLRGRRKDDAEREIAWRKIGETVMDFFYTNEDDLMLEMHYGSTGLAILKKLTPQGKPANPTRRIPKRHFTWRSFVKSALRER